MLKWSLISWERYVIGFGETCIVYTSNFLTLVSHKICLCSTYAIQIWNFPDLAVIDIRVIWIEGDWYEVAQDRRQWITICEQVCVPASGEEVCAANTLLINYFICACGHSFKHSGDLTRYQRFCGTQHPDHVNLDSPTFHYSCGRTFCRRGDLTRHSHFCKAM